MDFSPLKEKFKFIFNVRNVETDVLQNAPEGWLSTTIKYARSAVYNGLLRTFSTKIDFVTTGAGICRREYYKFGLMAWIQVSVMLLNPSTQAYASVFDGKIDFSTYEDTLTKFSVNLVNANFSANVDAYDSVQYAIPMDVDAAINLLLPPLTLKEAAVLVPSGPPDGIIHADYFPPIQIANNQQNSVNASVQMVPYSQLRAPNFATNPNWFYNCQFTGKVLFSGTITFRVDNTEFETIQTLGIFNQNGTLKLSIFNEAVSSGSNQTYTFNSAINVTKGDRLFLYNSISAEVSNCGITIKSGQINIAYQTVTPGSMCKALPASYVFEQLVQNMNVNTDSGPNLPVICQSFLLKGELSQLYITCSDSIRSALGSLYTSADQLFPGAYTVLSGTANYNGGVYTEGMVFPFVGGVNNFTGDGIVQKTQSVSIGTVFNPGDDLQAGATYLVGGNPGTYVIYNSIVYNVGQYFTYVLGQNTFAGSDDSSYVELSTEAPQLLLTFSDFFKSIKSVKGGQAAFGVDTYTAADQSAPELLRAQTGTPFIEDLSYVYRAGVGTMNLGNVTNFKYTPALDLMGNQINIGYKDQQYDAINGFSEVNSNQTYGVPLLTPATTIDLISPIRADPYGIEETRITQTDSAASKSDNNAFFVWVKPMPTAVTPIIYYSPVTGNDFVSVTGVDPSYYNLDITPKQNLLRGTNYLASIFYNMQGYSINFISGLKNTSVITVETLASGLTRRVAESDPVLISSLGAPLFIPIYCSFEPGLEEDALSQIDSMPYAEITANVNGVTTKVFNSEVSVDIGQNSEQTFKTLLSPNNTLSALVH